MIAGVAPSSGCEEQPAPTKLSGQVHLTLMHSSDIHSRLFPYNLQIGQVDAGLGLGPVDTISNVGGVARMSYIIGRERARSGRFLHLDGGDCFQGAPVFNFYRGEAEVRALGAMGTDAMIVANHEFDTGAKNLGDQLQKWATFPVLAANYVLEDPKQPGASQLGTIFKPFTVFDVDGLRVGVIGLGNLSSLTSIFDSPNRLGITPLNTTQVTQAYIDLLRPNVDLIVAVTHLGLDHDQDLIETTTGLDVVLGGHNHIVLQPPKHVQDCSRHKDPESGSFFVEVQGAEPGKVEKRFCRPRDVILAHSGAFAKYVGRLDLVVSNNPADFSDTYDPLNGFEVLTNDFQLFPINDTVPEDPIVKSLLEPYAQGLDVLANLDLLVGYAPDGSRRSSTAGGDSPLGNMIADAMWLRLGIQTDFSLTNTTGIRADLVPGPVTVEQMFNIFPFDNSISKMQLSGVELQQLFDFVARRSAGRGCVSQVQIAGARIVVDCSKDSVTDEGTSIGRGQATGIFIGAAQDPNGNVAHCTKDTDCPVHLAKCDEFHSVKANDPDEGKTFCAGLHDAAGAKIPCGSETDCPLSQFGQCQTESGVCWQPIDPFGYYELATSNYLAGGGSGFRVLQRNTTQFDTKVQQRDALIDYIRAGKACGAGEKSKELRDCSTDADCTCQEGADPALCNAEAGSYVCACPEAVTENETCDSSGGSCAGSALGGKCVLAACRRDVAAFQRATCADAPSDGVKQSCEKSIAPCASGGEQCKFLACVDRGLGNFTDNRLRMVGQ
ncbi:MAG: bifunctional metallophosphatase/5'-nucleotidase [Polyangiaceae bacterium]